MTHIDSIAVSVFVVIFGWLEKFLESRIIIFAKITRRKKTDSPELLFSIFLNFPQPYTVFIADFAQFTEVQFIFYLYLTNFTNWVTGRSFDKLVCEVLSHIYLYQLYYLKYFLVNHFFCIKSCIFLVSSHKLSNPDLLTDRSEKFLTFQNWPTSTGSWPPATFFISWNDNLQNSHFFHLLKW